ncbi:MAG TPA: ATPase, T2SS/T4P/T4SS family [Casimicrobiaceae bacterium]|nr:ATPase, T2SS/T4P/T4SS family [Casimicrobiaceae bacterium]
MSESAHATLIGFLVKSGLVPSEVAQAATADIATKGKDGSIIEWLARNNIMSEEHLAQALAGQLRLPYINLAAQSLDADVVSLIREELAARYKIIPLRTSDEGLLVATSNPLDREALRAVEFATRQRVRVAVATPTAVRDALQHAYHLDQALNEYLQGIPDEGELPVAEIGDEPTNVQSLMRDTALPPVIKLSNLILLEGIRSGASDVHIEAGASEVRVRYRIDGILEEAFRLPKWVQDPLIARCKVMSKLDITERRVPQDGRIRLLYRDAMVDLRVSSLPTQFGEKLTMRILDPRNAPGSLDVFGLSARDLECIRKAIRRPEGIVLVTGPTGSGKTTTLYGMLAELISPTRNVVTIENPIEYQLPGVNQVEINEKQGLTFAGTLRSILRQDPDVILVGEIRDAETAEIALRAAQTGHLVLSTLHTNDSASTIRRLLDLGIEPFMLASSLSLVMAQRLVRRICEQCAKPYLPDTGKLSALRIEPGAHRFRRGTGCSACRNAGFAGRVAVFEVMPITRRMVSLIEAKASDASLRVLAREEGMRLLADDAMQRACDGLTTFEEVVRVVDVSDDRKSCPSCRRTVEEAYAVCPHCATPLQSNCTSCGNRFDKDWQVCPFCGAAPKAATGLREAPPSPSAQARPPLGNDGAVRQFTALVVDDEPDFRDLVALSLERSDLGIKVEVASSGAAAIQRAQDRPPDLILLDVMMPEMDGFAVCERLRANVRTAFVPILMLTALDDPRNRARGFLAGTDDYLGKPFDRAELVARVRRLIQRTYGVTLPVAERSRVADEPGWEQATH